MKRDQLIGRLKQFNGKIKEQWCILHGDQMGIIAAKRYQIAGRTQAQCGIAQQNPAHSIRAFSGAHYRRRCY